MRNPRPDEYVSIGEAAEYFGYRSPSTLRKAAQDGHLRHVRAGPRAILDHHRVGLRPARGPGWSWMPERRTAEIGASARFLALVASSWIRQQYLSQ